MLLTVVTFLVVAIAVVSIFAAVRRGTAPARTPDAERQPRVGEAKAVAGKDKPEGLEDAPTVPPPEGAVVLFDGKSLGNWTTVDQEPARWEVLPGGFMQAQGGDIVTNQSFGGHFRLHAEFRVPFMPRATGQARGNSGVYVQGRYEVQILDSYGLRSTRWDCGAIGGMAAPRVNACKAPLVWQSYDIEFTALKCENGKITEPARMTVFQNGVLIHEDMKLVDKEGRPLTRTIEGLGGDPCRPGPIRLQEYGSPVQFRNIWLLPLRE